MKSVLHGMTFAVLIIAMVENACTGKLLYAALCGVCAVFSFVHYFKDVAPYLKEFE